MKELAYDLDSGKLPVGERKKLKLVRGMMKRSHKLTGRPVPRLINRDEIEWL